MFLLLFLRVGQKSGHDAEKWQIGAGIENEPDACLVREPSEEYRYSLSVVLTYNTRSSESAAKVASILSSMSADNPSARV